MEDLISIIIPVYKVDIYLNRCINSVVNQTYHNLEIILIDDGSPDRCPQICDEWGAKDSRIVVIHKQNGGLSDARNAGIQYSHGKYLAFIDSDDCVDSRFIACLYTQIKETGSQISCVSMREFSDNQPILADMGEYKTEVYSREKAIAALFDTSKFRDYAWNKMYDCALFNFVKYPYGKLMEDLAVTYRLIEQSSFVSYCPIKLYYYYQRADSILHGENKQLVFDRYECCKERFDYLKKKYPLLTENYKYFNTVILECFSELDDGEKAIAKMIFTHNIHYGLFMPTWKKILQSIILLVNGTVYTFAMRCCAKIRLGLQSKRSI